MLATLMGAPPAAPMEDTEAAGHSAANHLSRLHEDAQQGSPLAQYLLGAFYQLGEAIPQDYAEAANWYERAADQGLAVAQFALGALYAYGEGVSEDVVRAHMWLSLSAEIAGAQKLAREARELRDDVAQKMTPEQILEAEQLAREWKPKRER
jgi:TPR repeat protein